MYWEMGCVVFESCGSPSLTPVGNIEKFEDGKWVSIYPDRKYAD